MGRMKYNLCSACGLNTYESIGTTHDCPVLPRSHKRGKRCDEDPAKNAEWDRIKRLADDHNNFRTQMVTVRAQSLFHHIRKCRKVKKLASCCRRTAVHAAMFVGTFVVPKSYKKPILQLDQLKKKPKFSQKQNLCYMNEVRGLSYYRRTTELTAEYLDAEDDVDPEWEDVHSWLPFDLPQLANDDCLSSADEAAVANANRTGNEY